MNGMRVLLTGANGFVGSHILDQLRAEGRECAVLLRRQGDTRFIAGHLPQVAARYGSLEDVNSLRAALEDVSEVVHCAGATKALTVEGLFRANQVGTRRLVEAVNETRPAIRRLVLVSSLAAGRCATRSAPAHEEDPAAPLSAYGRSKLAGERAVTGGCRCEYTVLRPAGVYGPRDREFLRLFHAAAAGVVPVFGGGGQELSLVFAPDLAEVVVKALTVPAAAGQTLNVASAEVVTAGALVDAIAATTGRRVRRLPVPLAALTLVCAGASLWATLSRRPTVLAHGKWRELKAPGWVADTQRLRGTLGAVCETPMSEGLARTRAWYAAQGWLRAR
jgi:nucleoside-diphosphate-sugar epimerase